MPLRPREYALQDRQSDSCLTQPQVTTLKKLYDGSRFSNGEQIFPGYLPGAEDGQAGWGLWITGPAPGQSLIFAFGIGFFSSMQYEQKDWAYQKANVDEAVHAADKKFGNVLNTTQTDLKSFESHGGKLIIYHGWDDAAISALNSINYYNAVVGKMGQIKADSFLRLYMVPGMQHCSGGPGTDVFDDIATSQDPQHNMYVALENWVEKGTTPSSIIAAKLSSPAPGAAATMTRPLCVYPQAAKSAKGSGDTNDAANFVCAAPEK